MEIIYALIAITASTLLSIALAPKVQPPKPEAFDEIDFPQAEDGTPQCVIFGDCWVPDWTVIAVGNYRTTAIEKDAGGKK